MFHLALTLPIPHRGKFEGEQTPFAFCERLWDRYLVERASCIQLFLDRQAVGQLMRSTLFAVVKNKGS
jgi:hypothetical protein